MKENYVVPSIEVIEVELEGVLCASAGVDGVEDFTGGSTIGEW